MSQRPNILIITADGMRYDALRCNGNPLVQTPRLDALAQAGTRCERAYCTQPICMPCRASIMTGRYPSAHGVWQNGIPLNESEVTLPQLFAERGYRTLCFGKTHFRPWLPGLDPNEAAHQPEYLGDGPYYGFEQVRVADHSRQDRYFDWLVEHFPQHEALARNPALDRPDDANIAWKSTLPAEVTKSRYIADLSIEALRRLPADEPFLLWASFFDPHHPYNPSPPYCDLYDQVEFPRPPSNDGPGESLPRHYHDWVQKLRERWGHVDTAQRQWQQVRRMYQGKVSQVDHEIGRVLDALSQRGGDDETIVLFLSDHGTMLGDFGLMQVGEYSQEPLIHIPMIWRGPGVAAGAAAGLANTADVLPTLLDFAGIKAPLGVQGLSLRPLLEESTRSVREQLLVENRWGQAPPTGFRTLITDRYKLSVYTVPGEGELYDLASDPAEETNLFGQSEVAAVQAGLMERMARRLLRDADPLPQRVACW